MRTSFGSGRRARQKLEELNQGSDSTRKSRRRVKETAIVENQFIPVVVRDCREGNVTTKGTNTINFEWQHLVSKESFSTSVFENVAPQYIEHQIFDAILPDDVEDFDLEDLIGGGAFIKLKFNKKNDKTYMNIVEVKPLDAKYGALLHELLIAEQQEKQHKTDEINRFEDELKEMNVHDSFSHRPINEKPYVDVLDIDENDRNDNRINENEIDDIPDLNLDIDEDDINLDDYEDIEEDVDEDDESDSDYNSSRNYF